MRQFFFSLTQDTTVFLASPLYYDSLSFNSSDHVTSVHNFDTANSGSQYDQRKTNISTLPMPSDPSCLPSSSLHNSSTVPSHSLYIPSPEHLPNFPVPSLHHNVVALAPGRSTKDHRIPLYLNDNVHHVPKLTDTTNNAHLFLCTSFKKISYIAT